MRKSLMLEIAIRVALVMSLTTTSALADMTLGTTIPRKLCWTTFASPLDSGVNFTTPPRIEYPVGEGVRMGEGWVDLRFTIGADGIPRFHSVQDAVGSEIYSQYAIKGMAQARYEIPKSHGQPVLMNISSSPVDFHIEGSNRAGEHEFYQDAYDRAFRLRHEGKFQEAIDVLEDTIRQPLSLYGLTSAAFELSRSYQELGRLEEALFHNRHATIDDAGYIDRGLKREALARRIELEASNHNYWDAVCAYESFRDVYSDGELEPKFHALADQARTQLLGQAVIETDVRVIDRRRKDTEPFLRRRLIRAKTDVKVTSGQLTRAQVMCSTQTYDLSPGPALSFQSPHDQGACDLYVFAPPGTTLHIVETP